MDQATSSAAARPIQTQVCRTCGNIVTRPHLAALHVDNNTLPVLVRPSVRGIAHDVARRRGDVTVGEIFMGGRQRRIVLARHEVMYESREAGWTFPMIARRFPSEEPTRETMDHTSVMHGVRQHRKRRREAMMAAVQADNAASARLHGIRA